MNFLNPREYQRRIDEINADLGKIDNLLERRDGDMMENLQTCRALLSSRKRLYLVDMSIAERMHLGSPETKFTKVQAEIFSQDDSITMEEIAQMLCEYMELNGIKATEAERRSYIERPEILYRRLLDDAERDMNERGNGGNSLGDLVSEPETFGDSGLIREDDIPRGYWTGEDNRGKIDGSWSDDCGGDWGK